MLSSVALLLSLAASTLAYQITTPSQTVSWTNQGAQSVAWDRVNTDAANFTIVLTNEDRSVLPVNNQVLAALVDGTLGKTSVNPPSGGWPTGGSFRLNFVQDEQHTSTIYAQSSEFNITTPTSSSTSSGSIVSGTTRSGTTLVVSSTSGAAGSQSTSGSGTQSSSAANGNQSQNTTPPGSSGAISVRASAGLFAGVALLGAVLA